MPTLFILDLFLVLAFAYFVAAVLGPPSRPAYLVALFVSGWADLVLATEILSLFHLIVPWAMLAAHALLAAIAAALWISAGRPGPPRFSLPSRQALLGSLKDAPDLWVLGLAVGLTYVMLAVVNILVPPNNLDSLMYHLSRVVFWIQHQTLAPWPTSSLAQTTFPLNAEIGSLGSMLFLRQDSLAGFVQWSSALAALVSVFGLARGFGASRRQASFAALIFLSLPMIVLQATTTQNDLTTGAMMAAAIYLFLLGWRTQHKGALITSGAALGLALGMKYTAFMVLPGFGLGLAFLVLVRKPRSWRSLSTWAAACLVGFLALGAFNYAQNWLHFGNPFGVVKLIAHQTNRALVSPAVLTRSNVVRDIYSFLDFTGVPRPLARAAVKVKALAGEAVFKALHIPVYSPELNRNDQHFGFKKSKGRASEAGSFFGPLGFFLWLPLILYWSVAGFLKRDDRLIPALAFWGFMAVIGASQAWFPYRGRYYCLAMALCAPLVAGVVRRGPLMTVLRGFIAGLACLVMVVTVLTNVQKPLIGDDAIWTKTRFERRALVWDETRIPYRLLETAIPPQARVASILPAVDQAVYPLFGEKFGRRVIPIFPPPAAIDLKWLQDNPFPFVFVHVTGYCPVGDLPSSKYRVFTSLPYKIIVRLRVSRDP